VNRDGVAHSIHAGIGMIDRSLGAIRMNQNLVELVAAFRAALRSQKKIAISIATRNRRDSYRGKPVSAGGIRLRVSEFLGKLKG
jgi:hypothetical protein